MLNIVLFTLIPILSWIITFLFEFKIKYGKLTGWFLLIFCMAVLGSIYDIWAGVFLIVTFIFNVLSRIAWKNNKIKPKEAFKEFLYFLRF